MTTRWIRGPLWIVAALALFALPAQAQNQGTGIETATQAAGDGTGTFGNLLGDLLGLTPDEAKCWGRDGIRVNCIAPGLIKTEFARTLWEDPKISKASVQETALGRPQVLPPTPMPANIGRPPVQTGPPAGVGGGRF